MTALSFGGKRVKRALLVGLILSASLMAQPVPKVTDGQCKLESSGEIIKLVNVDPKMHFGMFAEGAIENSVRVYLTINSHPDYTIYIQAWDHGAYAQFARAPKGQKTNIELGTLVKDGEEKTQWLSCVLRVSED